jgi:hypothetical protein
MESYARLAGRLAADLGSAVVVGHSLGANVAIEMAGAGEFRAARPALAELLARGRVQVPAPARDRLSRSRMSQHTFAVGRVPQGCALGVHPLSARRIRSVQRSRPAVTLLPASPAAAAIIPGRGMTGGVTGLRDESQGVGERPLAVGSAPATT